MNEFDIIREMENCLDNECDGCRHKGNSGCVNSLLRDAVTVMKMQVEAVKDFPAEIERLKMENESLLPMARIPVGEDELVEAVNLIICSAYWLGRYRDDDECYMSLLRRVFKFIEMLPSEHAVWSTSIDAPPQLIKKA